MSIQFIGMYFFQIKESQVDLLPKNPKIFQRKLSTNLSFKIKIRWVGLFHQPPKIAIFRQHAASIYVFVR